MEDKKDNSIVNLVNPEFDFGFMGVTYHLRKATLDKLIMYQEKVKELENNPSSDAKLTAYSIYIMLRDKIENLTEQTVLENTPADVDTISILETLGFMSPTKAQMAKNIQEILEKKLNGEKSS